MDTGREYTERWHHQMQVRDAVARPRLLSPRWMEPLLDISVRALPHAFAQVNALSGTTVTLAVRGETSGAWTLARGDAGWQVCRGRPAEPSTTIGLAADDVWRMFYNALTPEELGRRVTIAGDARLAAPLLRARSVIL